MRRDYSEYINRILNNAGKFTNTNTPYDEIERELEIILSELENTAYKDGYKDGFRDGNIH